MTILEVIKQRYSVRRFKPLVVEEEKIKQILEAARWAPSAGNLQPWYFYVVRDRTLREQLAAAALQQGFVAAAPVCIVVCAVPEQSARVYGRRGVELYCLQDTAAAIQNMLLTAVSLGLGTCWVGAFQVEEVKKALALPPGHEPVALIPLGYPDDEPARRPGRKPLEDVVSWL